MPFRAGIARNYELHTLPGLLSPGSLKNYRVIEMTDILHPELVYDGQGIATTKRIKECVDQAWKIYVQCDECKAHVITSGHCFIRYCTNCFENRLNKVYARMRPYREKFNKFSIHLILTIPYQTFSKEVKRSMEDAKRKFLQQLRRRGYQFIAIAAFDFGNPKGDNPLDTNLHIHMALNNRWPIASDKLQKYWAAATGVENAVIKAKWRPTKSVLGYIANRAAGQLGHKNEQIFYPDIMDVKTFNDYIRGARHFYVSTPKPRCPECNTAKKIDLQDLGEHPIKTGKIKHFFHCKACGILFVPKAFSCITVPIYHREKCECGGYKRIMGVSWYGSFIFMSLDYIVPGSEHPGPRDPNLWQFQGDG